MKATILINFLALVFLTACGPTTQTSQAQQPNVAKDITVQEFDKMDVSAYHLVDVRTPQEYAQGHIEGSVNIDWNGPGFMEKMDELSKDKGVILYCRSGGRSASAMKKLSGSGYTELYNVLGGYMQYEKTH